MKSRKILYSVKTQLENYRENTTETLDEKVFESGQDAVAYAEEQIERTRKEAEKAFSTHTFTVQQFVDGGAFISSSSGEIEYSVFTGRFEVVPDSRKKEKLPKYLYISVGEKLLRVLKQDPENKSKYATSTTMPIEVDLNDEMNKGRRWEKAKLGRKRNVWDQQGLYWAVYTNAADLFVHI